MFYRDSCLDLNQMVREVMEESVPTDINPMCHLDTLSCRTWSVRSPMILKFLYFDYIFAEIDHWIARKNFYGHFHTALTKLGVSVWSMKMTNPQIKWWNIWQGIWCVNFLHECIDIGILNWVELSDIFMTLNQFYVRNGSTLKPEKQWKVQFLPCI